MQHFVHFVHLPKHVILHFLLWQTPHDISSRECPFFPPSVNVRFSVAHKELTQGV